MTEPLSDDRIRERFQRLRSETEAGRVPDFRSMMERAKEEPAPVLPSRRRRMVWAGGFATAAVAATLAAVLLTRGPDPDEEFEQLVASYASDAGAWRSPTSGLLNVPGSDLVRSVPSVR